MSGPFETKWRRLTIDDLPRITEICAEVFFGRDTLPADFPTLIKDPDCHFSGVELNGELAVLGNLRLLDNNTTLWSEYLRTDPKHRQKGLVRIFQRGMVEKLMPELFKRFGIVRMRSSTAFGSVTNQVMEKQGRTPILTVRMLRSSRGKEISAKLESSSGFAKNKVEQISASKLFAELRKLSAGEREQLISLNVLNFNWKIYEFMPENETVFEKHAIFAEFGSGSKLFSFSLGKFCPHPRGENFWAFSVFAPESKPGAASILHHIKAQTDQSLQLNVPHIEGFIPLFAVPTLEQTGLEALGDPTFANYKCLFYDFSNIRNTTSKL